MWLCERCGAGNPDDCKCRKQAEPQPAKVTTRVRVLTREDLTEINMLRTVYDELVQYSTCPQYTVEMWTNPHHESDVRLWADNQEGLEELLREYFRGRAKKIADEALATYNVQLAS